MRKNNNLKLSVRIFLKYSLWRYIVVIGSIAFCCWLNDKWLEGVAFVVVHLALRYKFNYQYHSNFHCMELTNFIIWVSIPTTTDIFISLLASIPIAFFVCWVGNEEQEKLEWYFKYMSLKKQLTKKSFDIDHCTREELIDRCNELGFSADNKELAIKFFVDKESIWTIAKELNIEYDSANMRKKRLKKKLKY